MLRVNQQLYRIYMGKKWSNNARQIINKKKRALEL